MKPTQILNFWFNEIEPALWFKKDLAFDALITNKFSAIHREAVNCELFHWRKTVEGRLAEIIILDQFSRNMYRDTPASFSSDSLALALAQEAVLANADQALTNEQRSFLYMPFMHSESAKIHQVALHLYQLPGLEANLNFELRHKAIIDQFGRYPHRNTILNRPSTPEEIEFLTQAGSSF